MCIRDRCYIICFCLFSLVIVCQPIYLLVSLSHALPLYISLLAIFFFNVIVPDLSIAIYSLQPKDSHHKQTEKTEQSTSIKIIWFVFQRKVEAIREKGGIRVV